MWEVVLAVLLPTIAPGLALLRILDASADTFRKALLCFPIGLLTVYGTSGLLFVIQAWSVTNLTIALVLLNALSIAFLFRKVHVERTTYTQWQKMEAAIHGLVLSESEPEIEQEVAAQQWFQSNRNPLLQIAAACFCLLTLVPIIMFDRPFGVDWIGFSTLASHVAQSGTFEVPSPNTGLWTYPPAFPTILAWIVNVTGSSIEQSILVLGHLSLFALLLGIWGSMDRLGAGASSVLAMGSSFALFAKVFDSGYPTVASQLGLIVGLMIVLRPIQQSLRYHLLAFVFLSICTVLIHPTGAIYLAALLVASLLSRERLSDDEHSPQKPIFLTSILIVTSMFVIALIYFAPRMLSEPVFAEYGWQGGKPMLMFNGPLMFFASVAIFMGRRSLEIQLLSLWFLALWLLSLVHLIEGLANIQVLSLLSYTLYSMALHAYHVPLAVIVGLLASRSTSLTTFDDEKAWLGLEMDPFIRPLYSSIFLVMLVIGSMMSVGLLTNLSSHEELHATTSGDAELRTYLMNHPPDKFVYSENVHWGHSYAFDASIQTTSIPTLGLLTLDDSIQGAATTAIRMDDIEALNQLGIGYAVSSPIGTIALTLGPSPYWSIEQDFSGARYWKLWNEPSPSRVTSAVAMSQDECITMKGCTLEEDPWRNHRFNDPLERGDDRIVLNQKGIFVWNEVVNQTSLQGLYKVCIVYEQIGSFEDYSIRYNGQSLSFEKSGGWNMACQNVQLDQRLHVEFELNSDGSSWINPLGFSGRSSQIVDSTGLRIHHLELNRVNPAKA
ncbi:MAG: hypothetical protein VXY42_01295 [Candidatus Thermoplasmatota archaeon]|nr:hypothetical protein [Candidatus Thermoplasmatota archaeon]MEC8609120.1 hypothetical protein [Candidatus Thermoplasmatota archaeon]